MQEVRPHVYNGAVTIVSEPHTGIACMFGDLPINLYCFCYRLTIEDPNIDNYACMNGLKLFNTVKT